MDGRVHDCESKIEIERGLGKKRSSFFPTFTVPWLQFKVLIYVSMIMLEGYLDVRFLLALFSKIYTIIYIAYSLKFPLV